MKFFISYSRSVKTDVSAIVKLLRATGHEVWWDGDIPEIADWWATILDRIEWCEVFVFFVSEKSVQSPYCLAELDYGRRRNRPILPFIIDDHKQYRIPPGVIERQQWYKYDGDLDRVPERITAICQQIDWDKYADIYATRPAEPNKGSGSITKQFQQAVGLAEDGQFKQAVMLFRNVSSLDFNEWGEECQEWIGRVHLYEEIMELADHSSTMHRAKRKWKQYTEAYGTLFDPFDIAKVAGSETPPRITTNAGVTAVPALPAVTDNLTRVTRDIIGDPFTWIEIPGGSGTMETNDPNVTLSIAAKPYWIAKYPVTNAQFAKFIEAGGYQERKWWTDAGWRQREQDSWTEPRYWNDSKWNGTEHPVVGVSWYEVVAFCNWLDDVVRATHGSPLPGRITLPTEAQWQYAAQGDDGRAYPWGNEWNRDHCNNNVDGKDTVFNVKRQSRPIDHNLPQKVARILGCRKRDESIYASR